MKRARWTKGIFVVCSVLMIFMKIMWKRKHGFPGILLLQPLLTVMAILCLWVRSSSRAEVWLSLCPGNAQQRPELAGPPNTLVELGELQRLVALRTWQGDPVSLRSESTATFVYPVIKAKSQPPLWAENGGTPGVSCQISPEWSCVLNLNLGPVAIRGQSILREERTLLAERHLKSFPLTHPPNPTSEANIWGLSRWMHPCRWYCSLSSFFGFGPVSHIARANAFNV